MIPAIKAENGGAFYSDNFIHIFLTDPPERWTIPVNAIVYARTIVFEEYKTMEISLQLISGEELKIIKYEDSNRIEVVLRDSPILVRYG